MKTLTNQGKGKGKGKNGGVSMAIRAFSLSISLNLTSYLLFLLNPPQGSLILSRIANKVGKSCFYTIFGSEKAMKDLKGRRKKEMGIYELESSQMDVGSGIKREKCVLWVRLRDLVGVRGRGWEGEESDGG